MKTTHEWEYARPQLIATPDIARLVETTEAYMTELGALEPGNTSVDSDYDHYIYEEVMTALYGKAVWGFINERSG